MTATFKVFMSPYHVGLVVILFMNHLYCVFCGEINKYSSSINLSARNCHFSNISTKRDVWLRRRSNELKS